MEEGLKEGFVYSQDAKNILAYLFLKEFHERFMRTIDRISTYLSEYEKYSSPFSVSDRAEMVRAIKQDLLSVVYVLNSIKLDPGSSYKVKKLVSNLDKIMNAIVFSQEQLEELLEILSEIVAKSFLKDLIKYVPKVEERMKGDFD